jgi:hypothetical protein
MAWAKLSLGFLVVAVLGIIVGTVWIGATVREDTVVAHPYEEGVRHHSERAGGAVCDLADGPCTGRLDGGGEVTLEIAPRPIRTMTDLTVRLDLAGGGDAEQVVIAFAMPGMEMGRNEVRLEPSGGGRFGGGAVLVRCPSGRRDWIAEVRVERPGAPRRTVRFQLGVRE